MVNIFVTDFDPLTAARDSCDSYVVKVPIEVAMLLSAIHWRTGYEGPVGSGMPLAFDNGTVQPSAGPYRDSKVISSSSETYRWLVKSTGNYGYAVAYGLELIEEHRRRYGGTHRTEGVLLWLMHKVPDIPAGPMTSDVGLAMPDKYKNRNDITGSYRKYIMYEKMSVVSWKRGKVPDWYLFVYTDGAASGNGTGRCKATYAVWFGEDDPRNACGEVTRNPSNQSAELSAIRVALEILKDDPRPHAIVTDSRYCIDCLTEWVHAWRNNGWRTSGGKPVKHMVIIREAADMLRGNMLVHVRSHAPEPRDISSAAWAHWYGNRQADAMAARVMSSLATL